MCMQKYFYFVDVLIVFKLICGVLDCLHRHIFTVEWRGCTRNSRIQWPINKEFESLAFTISSQKYCWLYKSYLLPHKPPLICFIHPWSKYVKLNCSLSITVHVVTPLVQHILKQETELKGMLQKAKYMLHHWTELISTDQPASARDARLLPAVRAGRTP